MAHALRSLLRNNHSRPPRVHRLRPAPRARARARALMAHLPPPAPPLLQLPHLHPPLPLLRPPPILRAPHPPLVQSSAGHPPTSKNRWSTGTTSTVHDMVALQSSGTILSPPMPKTTLPFVHLDTRILCITVRTWRTVDTPIHL